MDKDLNVSLGENGGGAAGSSRGGQRLYVLRHCMLKADKAASGARMTEFTRKGEGGRKGQSWQEGVSEIRGSCRGVAMSTSMRESYNEPGRTNRGSFGTATITKTCFGEGWRRLAFAAQR